MRWCAARSQAGGGDVPRDVAGTELRHHLFGPRAVLPAILTQLVLILRADVDLERAVAVQIREVDGVLESRGRGVDERLPPSRAVVLEEPQAGRERARDQ